MKRATIQLPSALFVGLVLSVAAMTMADDTAPPAHNSGVCEGLFRAANTMDFDHAWTGTMRLRQMESSCVGSDNERTYWHMRATMENLSANTAPRLSTTTGRSAGAEPGRISRQTRSRDRLLRTSRRGPPATGS